jgi:hypothetical protein
MFRGPECPEIVEIERPRRARISYNCHVKFQGKYVDLSFAAVRNPRTARWEIDGIEFK